MESSQRGALGLVRLVAAGIMLIGVLDGGTYLTQYVTPYFERHLHPELQQSLPPLKIWRLALDAIPVIVGLVILIKAKVVAEWLSDVIE